MTNNKNTTQKMRKGYKKTKLGWIPEEWEVKRLKEITKVLTGSTPKTGDKDNYGNEYFFVSPTDLGKTKFISNTIKKLSIKGFEQSRSMPKGSVLFTCIGSTIGKSGISDRELTSNQQINAVLPSKYHNNEFIYYELVKLAPRIKLLAGTQAVPLINKTEFELTFIPLPPLPEQQKIAKILSTWDVAIDKLTQLIALKEKHKKGLMQVLLTGKVRFNGFTEEWKEVRLGEVCEIKSSNISANTLKDNSGEYKVFGASGYIQNIDFYREDEPYISIVKDGAGVGRTLLCEAKSSVLGTLDVIKPKDTNNINFLYSLINRIYFTKYITGSTIPHIYFKDYSKEKVRIPTLPEQQKIATILSTADAGIEKLKAQLNTLKTQKKGLMQQLLTGKTRVKV